MEKVSLLLVGIGGFGRHYLEQLINEDYMNDYELKGVVDSYPQNSPYYSYLLEREIPIYYDLQECFLKNEIIDLVIICTPIQYHKEMVLEALKQGCHVLCEKPIAGCLDDALIMKEAQMKSGQFVAIGYQWSYSKAINTLKKDIMGGVYGKPIRLKSLVISPRDKKYYKRSWAGKLKDKDERCINDSIANNAAAHQLHNMLFLLGKHPDASAKPRYVNGELYKVYDIENFDTITSYIITEDNVEILYVASHATSEDNYIRQEYVFEKGVVSMNEKGEFIGEFQDGTIRHYGNPSIIQHSENKLYQCIRAIINKSNVICHIDTALSHSMCIDALHKSTTRSIKIPDKYIKEESNRKYIEELKEDLIQCYNSNKMLSDLPIEWSKAGKTIIISNKG